jgi:ferritin-like metal-binding protein YciE
MPGFEKGYTSTVISIRNVPIMKKEIPHTLSDLLVIKLRSLYDIEQQLVEALPAMATAATDKELKAGFKKHLTETKNQVKRLKAAFKLLKEKPEAMKVDAIRGLVKDANWTIKNVKGPEALDAALIAAAQYIEHYEMAGYMSAIDWAQEAGHSDVAKLLEETLEEEVNADEALADLADSTVNRRANG